MNHIPVIAWVAFNLFIIAMLVLDLKVFHRRPHEIRMREALGWSAFWIALSLLFNLGVYIWLGRQAGLEFLTGYIIEKSLSVDNIFVFLVIFSYFRVPPLYQHKILFWGVLGALVLRAVFILAGITLINSFHWIIYVFGAFLVVSGIKFALEKDKEIDPEKNIILRIFRRVMPISDQYDGARFITKVDARRLATPLLVVLLVVETTDVIFAVDSIPAILAITRDAFIVYTSNVFAILGLRALYFVLSRLKEIFHHLHYGLSIILVFVGIKMLLAEVYEIPISIALGAVGGILALSIVLSLIFKPKPSD